MQSTQYEHMPTVLSVKKCENNGLYMQSHASFAGNTVGMTNEL